ncbi:MAG: cobalamin-dependent protein, partial [Planctomycetota bacterium]
MITSNSNTAGIPSPDAPLRCLMVQPAFAETNYWNYTKTAKGIGAHTPAPPLGLMTVAAMLPNHWDIRLLDLNVRDWKESDWDVDIVCVGGMLPQQAEILKVIEDANRRGKYVVCGGADPSSQPDVYSMADVVVVGEGEA